MILRDVIEATVRAWHRSELDHGRAAIVDYDCDPAAFDAPPADSRLGVYRSLTELQQAASVSGGRQLSSGVDAHLTYLLALLGERLPLDEYVRRTQGCAAAGWPSDHVEAVGQRAQAHLAELGITWGQDTEHDLEESEGRLEPSAAPDAIRSAAAELEPVVRQATATSAPYELTIETTDADAYWSYWLDGSGQQVRLRLNLRKARFTKIRARQFALHEVLGHGLQSASFAQRCAQQDVPWLRLLSVHAPQQVLLEGLAQALPLFVAPDDKALTSRVRLDHYLQLVQAELHIAINADAGVEACAAHARHRVPFWTDAQISDLLTDRSVNPQLRSYLWAYPAGLDWFAALAEADVRVGTEVLNAAYRAPLTPAELEALWPAGPPIGGPGGSIRLRQPPVP